MIIHKMKDEGYLEKPIFSKDGYCQHGQAADVHCCYCHSGFLFGHEEHEKCCPYYKFIQTRRK